MNNIISLCIGMFFGGVIGVNIGQKKEVLNER